MAPSGLVSVTHYNATKDHFYSVFQSHQKEQPEVVRLFSTPVAVNTDEAKETLDFSRIPTQFTLFCSTTYAANVNNRAEARRLINNEWKKVSLALHTDKVQELLNEMDMPEGARRSRIVAKAKEAETQVNATKDYYVGLCLGEQFRSEDRSAEDDSLEDKLVSLANQAEEMRLKAAAYEDRVAAYLDSSELERASGALLETEYNQCQSSCYSIRDECTSLRGTQAETISLKAESAYNRIEKAHALFLAARTSASHQAPTL